MKRIEDQLCGRTGIDAASISHAGIHRAVSTRMRGLGLHSLDEYEALLQRLPAEWNELVETIVVTESWFFRDQTAIGAFARLVVQDWLPAHPGAALRLLSVPCASGEEPYSLAMALLDAGVAPDKFQIRAVDISARALEHAKRGIYGKNSFRGGDLGYRKRFFQRTESGYLLAPRVRGSVSFRTGNLLSDRFLQGSPAFDFIFCRNLLIYFGRPAQRQALARLARLLAPDGLLFVAPVELAIALEHGFVSSHLPSTFACRRGRAPARDRRLRSGGNPPVSTPGALPPPFSPLSDPLASYSSTQTTSPPQADLEAARRLADEGRLKEAAEVCGVCLRRHRDCAEAHYLLGLVRDASGDAGAIDCYRKALYLEPNHYESLLQLAVLLRKSGELARARAVRDRAQRLRSNTVDA